MQFTADLDNWQKVLIDLNSWVDSADPTSKQQEEGGCSQTTDEVVYNINECKNPVPDPITSGIGTDSCIVFDGNTAADINSRYTSAFNSCTAPVTDYASVKTAVQAHVSSLATHFDEVTVELTNV